MELALLAISIGGLIFFLTRWIQLLIGYRSMSEVERRYAEVIASQDEKTAEDTSLKTKRRKLFAQYGMKDSMLPVVAVVGFGYLTVASVLRAVGLTEVMAAAIALPTALVIVVVGRRVASKRRADRFNEQMVTLLELLTAQIRGGTGVQRALTAVLPSLQDPIYTEIDRALKVSASGGDLIEALGEIRNRYPSRALDLFLAALEIDRAEGHSIVPSLEQAAAIMKNAFALQSEGRAELASAKWEFYGVFAVIMGLSAQMIFASGNAQSTWANPLGMLVLILAMANSVFGLWRFTRIVGKLKKETE